MAEATESAVATATTDPVTELADLQIKVWRYARTVAVARGWEPDETLEKLDLPSADFDEQEALDIIRAGVFALRSADVPDLLAAYPDRVRLAAAQAADEEGWCSYGLNQALRELALPGWHGMYATVAADVRLADTDEQRAPLTVATLTPLLRAYSEDEDVVVVHAPTVDLVVYDETEVNADALADPGARIDPDRMFTASVRVRVLVPDLVPRDTAEDWTTRAVIVEPYSEYVGLGRFGGYYLDSPKITWDGDAPNI